MPQVVPAIVSAVSAVGSYAGALGVAASEAGLVTGLQVAALTSSVVYSSSQNAKMRKALAAANLDQGRTVMSRDPIAPRRLIYGQVLVSGNVVFIHTTGTKNEYLHFVVVLAGHECEEIGDIYFGDEVVPLDGSGNATGKYAGYARVKKFLGLAVGERDTVLEGETGLWTSNHLGKGIARIHVRLKWTPDLFPSGMPTIKALTKGKKVLDPRVGIYSRTCDITSGIAHIGCSDVSSLAVGMLVTGRDIVPGTRIVSIDGSGTFFTVDVPPIDTDSAAMLSMGVDSWSQNSALVSADYITCQRFGRGVLWERLMRRSAEFIEAANICDEDVVLA